MGNVSSANNNEHILYSPTGEASASNKINNFSHSAIGVFGMYHSSRYDKNCDLFVGFNGVHQNPLLSVITCNGGNAMKKKKDNIKLLNYLYFFAGAPIIKYDINVYKIQKKKEKTY